MRIIKQRERVESVEYHRSFEYEDMPGAGFGFECDEQGNIAPPKNDAARASLAACLSGTVEITRDVQYRSDGEGDYVPIPGTGHKVSVRMIDKGVIKYEHSHVEPAIGECACGEQVELRGFTNTCHRCRRDYNMSGQGLASREQWGEETGESAADILAVDIMDPERCFEE